MDVSIIRCSCRPASKFGLLLIELTVILLTILCWCWNFYGKQLATSTTHNSREIVWEISFLANAGRVTFAAHCEPTKCTTLRSYVYCGTNGRGAFAARGDFQENLLFGIRRIEVVAKRNHNHATNNYSGDLYNPGSTTVECLCVWGMV